MTGGRNEQPVPPPAGSACDEAAVRRQLDRILQSPAFASSPQLCAFLSYVVDQRLKGNESRIKGYTIAVEALGRANSFDPAADPIIRVEAARLRRLLGEYYDGPGAGDPVVIDVPKGGYVPVFETRAAPQAPPARAGGDPLGRSRLPWVVAGSAAAALLVLAAVAGLNLWPDPDRGAVPPVAAVTPETTGSPAGAPLFKGELPRVHVAEIAVDGEAPQPATFSPAKVQANLATALGLFSEIELSERAEEADYAVEGRASFTDGAVFLSFLLVYTPEHEIVWSALFDLTYDRNAADLAEDRIVRNVAGAIARPYGVIFNHAASHRDDASQVSEEYRCVLQTFNSQRRFAPDTNARSRDCLTALAQRQADFKPARALLPMLYVDAARYGAESEQERRASLAQALVLARHAVAAAPESARAHQALQSVLLFLGRSDEALEAGRRARQLNPYDTDIMASHASTLIMLGEDADGLALMLEARRASPGYPAWYDTMVVFAAHGMGDLERVRKEAVRIRDDDTLPGLLARILAAGDGAAVALTKDAAKDGARAGNGDADYDMLKKLVAQRPEFERDPAAALDRIFPSPHLRGELLDALRKAGLKAPS